MKKIPDIFDCLMQNHDTKIARLLGDNYMPEKEFNHYEDVKIATLLSDNDDDGQDVIIYESRAPARFFKIKALDTPNSVGDIQKGFTLSTGSDVDQLAYDIAIAIHTGMLVVSDD